MSADTAPAAMPGDAIDDTMADKHRCRDFDEDCDDLEHTRCWLHDPTQGWCPFLRAAAAIRAQGE